MSDDAPSGSVDWDELSQVPGSLPKPRSKRDKSKGRKVSGSSLTTYAKLTPVNRERRDERHDVAYGPQAAACRLLRVCCACGKVGDTDPHHVTSRGAGGDDSCTVPLCRRCHTRVHAAGQVTFWREVGIDPADVILGIQAWMQAGYPMDRLP